jgi:hypothetical protein
MNFYGIRFVGGRTFRPGYTARAGSRAAAALLYPRARNAATTGGVVRQETSNRYSAPADRDPSRGIGLAGTAVGWNCSGEGNDAAISATGNLGRSCERGQPKGFRAANRRGQRLGTTVTAPLGARGLKQDGSLTVVAFQILLKGSARTIGDGSQFQPRWFGKGSRFAARSGPPGGACVHKGRQRGIPHWRPQYPEVLLTL